MFDLNTHSDTQSELQLKHEIELLRQERDQLKNRLEEKDKHIDDMRTAILLLEHSSKKQKRWYNIFG